MNPAPAATATVDDARLPTQLRRLVRALGWDRTMALVREHGGQRIRIPQHEVDVVLADIIGTDGVQRLRAEFAGLVWMDVPKPDKVTQQLRNRRAAELRAGGKTLNQVAAELGISRRHVLNVFRGAGPGQHPDGDAQQPDLFPGAADSGRQPL